MIVMTDMGYKHIIDRIVNRMVDPPQDRKIDTLSAWLDGYATCQNDIILLIKELSQGQKE